MSTQPGLPAPPLEERRDSGGGPACVHSIALHTFAIKLIEFIGV